MGGRRIRVLVNDLRGQGGGGGEDETGHLVIIIYISPFLRVARSWQKNNVVS